MVNSAYLFFGDQTAGSVPLAAAYLRKCAATTLSRSNARTRSLDCKRNAVSSIFAPDPGGSSVRITVNQIHIRADILAIGSRSLVRTRGIEMVVAAKATIQIHKPDFRRCGWQTVRGWPCETLECESISSHNQVIPK